MRVLFVSRPDLVTHPGGDTTQLLKTKEALEKLGVEVKLGMAKTEELEWADIVHVFNIQTPDSSLPAALLARAAGKKVALSTIWWNMSHTAQISRLSKLGLLYPNPLMRLSLPIYRLAEHLYGKDVKERQEIKRLLQNADLLLPNSEEEMEIIKAEFQVHLPPHHVVMNAVDTDIFKLTTETPRSGVVCCGRVEPLKNQLMLIRAVANIGEQLTLIGKPGGDKKYNAIVKSAIERSGFTWITEHQSQENIARLIRKHRVHALPSFRESPGLSSLEALATGANAVVSDKEFCPIDTYFSSWLDKKVYVCDPYSIKSIQRSLKEALAYSVPIGKFPDKFTWAQVAVQTLEGYHALL